MAKPTRASLNGPSRLAGSSKLLRAMNSTAALSLLLERGRLTRGELREATGLSKPTVSDALRRLVDAGLATVVGHTSGGPGPNAEIYAINPDAAYAAAVSVGNGPQAASGEAPPHPNSSATVAAALCDVTGTVRASTSTVVDLRGTSPADVVTETVSNLVGLAGVSRARLERVQLGVAGAYDPATSTIHHIDLVGFDQPGLVTDIASRLGVPVEIDNDVNLAAIAERRHGRGSQANSFALLWLSDGLGLAIDLGGQLLRGARGGAGEIGYLTLTQPDGGDTKTDLQDLLGAPAVRELAARHGHYGATAEQAVAAGRADKAFIAALAGRVAVALGVVVSVLDPELAVLAGPVSRGGGETLRNAVVAALRATPLPDTPIEITGVSDDPVVRGGLDAAVAAVHAGLRSRVEPDHDIPI